MAADTVAASFRRGAVFRPWGSRSKLTLIATLVDASKLCAVIDVPESEVRFVRAGSRAPLTVDAYPDRAFDGTISRVAGALDPA